MIYLLAILEVTLICAWRAGVVPWWVPAAPAALYIVALMSAVGWGMWETRDDEDFTPRV